MVARMLAFALGVVLAHGAPELPPAWVWGLLGVMALAGLWRRLRLPAFLALGVLWALLNAQLALSHRLPAELEGMDLVVEGTIVGLPQAAPRYSRFELVPERMEPAPARLPRRLRLAWYDDAPPLVPGDRWQLTVRLKRPHGNLNPGGFDFERWLFQRRIDAAGYVRNKSPSQRLAQVPSLDRVRHALAGRLNALLGPRPGAGMLVALVVGDGSAISDSQWEVLRATGTTHAVTVSGLHVGFLALVGFLAVRALWRRSARLCLWLPARQAGLMVGMLLAVGYAALAGFALPTQRSLIMLLVPALALILRRRLSPWYAWTLALVLVLLWDPFGPLSAGFWLSFGAVAVLLAVGLGHSPGSRVRRLAGVQLAISAALVPLTVAWFQQASWISPLANLAAVPAFSLVVPLALGASVLAVAWPWLGGLALAGTAALIEWLMWGLERLAALPGAHGYLPEPAPLVLALSLLAAALIVAPRGLGGRWLALLLLAPLIWPRLPRPGPDQALVTVLDVGQGLAVVVESATRTLLYDTGPGFGGGHDAAGRTVLPYLRSRGIQRLDVLVVSHADSDHAGGVRTVLDGVAVETIYVGEALDAAPQARPCRAGQSWAMDGLALEFLWPPPEGGYRGNEASCVLLLQAGEHKVLIAGDIERRAEAALLARQAPLAATLLVVPHHGSLTSSTPAFVSAVTPRDAVFTVGYRNRYRLPREPVQARYRQAGSRLLRTDSAGALQFALGPDGVGEARRYRDRARRYYHLRPELD